MHCALYARVSTDKQADKDLSIPAQLRLMREHARRQNWTIVEEFIEAGESATTADRPVLQAVLARISAGTLKVDALMVHKLNRMARNIDDFVPIRMLLRKHGVRLAYVVERVDETASGQLLENIMASIAQFESANLSDETKKGMRQKVLNGGWPHKPPRGYVVNRHGENASRIDIHPREGALVRRAFELYASDLYSIETLGEHLAKEGLVSRGGLSVPKSQLHRMLTNEFYVGRIHWKDLNVAGTHPPLVDPELFQRVQTVIQRRYRPPSTRFVNGLPLRGLAICGTCRGHITGEWHDKWGYYRCSRQSYRRALCASRLCPASRAHADLERILRQRQLTRQTAATIRRAAQRIVAERHAAARAIDHDARLAELLNEEMRFTDAFAVGDIDPNLYRTKTADMRQIRAHIELERQRSSYDPAIVMKRVSDTLDFATSLADIYATLSHDRRAPFLRAVFSTVVVHQGGILSYSLTSRLRAIVEPIPPNGRAADAHATALIDAELAA